MSTSIDRSRNSPDHFRRFETLESLGAATRDSLSDAQADLAIETMGAYFQPGKPVYSWFGHLERIVSGVGAAFGAGSAAHLDLVQEATNPTWSILAKERPSEAEALLKADLPLLRWEIETFPIRLVLCNGRSAFDRVVSLLQATIGRCGTAKRVTWWTAKASAGGRDIVVAGWNIPLVRPTGLGSSGEAELGATLAIAARAMGLDL